MNQLVPLTMVSSGRTVQLADVRCGWGLQRKLADMGLTPGLIFRVISSQMPGPVIIDVRGSRLALGHGMALRILVKEV